MCVNKYKQIEHCLIIAVLAFYPIQLVIPPPQNVRGGYTGFTLSRRSVRPSPIRVRSITPLLMEGFPSNLNDTFTSTRDVQSPCCPCVSSRSRSQLKVKYLRNKYYTLCCVHSITPLLMEGFPLNLNDTFTSTWALHIP